MKLISSSLNPLMHKIKFNRNVHSLFLLIFISCIFLGISCDCACDLDDNYLDDEDEERFDLSDLQTDASDIVSTDYYADNASLSFDNNPAGIDADNSNEKSTPLLSSNNLTIADFQLNELMINESHMACECKQTEDLFCCNDNSFVLNSPLSKSNSIIENYCFMDSMPQIITDISYTAGINNRFRNSLVIYSLYDEEIFFNRNDCSCIDEDDLSYTDTSDFIYQTDSFISIDGQDVNSMELCEYDLDYKIQFTLNKTLAIDNHPMHNEPINSLFSENNEVSLTYQDVCKIQDSTPLFLESSNNYTINYNATFDMTHSLFNIIPKHNIKIQDSLNSLESSKLDENSITNMIIQSFNTSSDLDDVLCEHNWGINKNENTAIPCIFNSKSAIFTGIKDFTDYFTIFTCINLYSYFLEVEYV